MPDAAWKAFERRVAKIFGGKRRGAYTRDASGGKSDVICDGWSVEVKLRKRVTYGMITEACEQAEDNRECDSDIPVAVVKKKYANDDDALVVMRLETFREWFL